MMLNKKFSKVLCAILAFAMLVTMLPAMALVASADEAAAETSVNKLAFSDIANSPYQREIGVLNAISVLAGDPEGTFRPGDSISRAEMAAIIVRIYGMESSVVPGVTKFEDVPADHWSSGYVNIASGLGVINGDGNGKFRPDDKVKYNEAVKMLVCVLGYGLHAQENGGWPAGYLVQATTLGIDEDVINQSGEASRETVAKLVYNTIDLEYLEKVGYGTEEQWVSVEGRTLLSEKMKVTKLEDIVSETYTTSLFGEGDLKEGQVRIGTTRLLLGESDIAKYVGYPVIAYAKFDPKVDKNLSTLAYYEIMEEDVVIIEAITEEFAGATAKSITLYEDYENSAKTITYTTDDTTYIFENGVGNMAFDVSSLYKDGKATFEGKLVIIDIDDDQVIDSLFVQNTDTIVVSSIAKSNKGFYIRGKYTNERYPANNKLINLADETAKISILKDGEQVEYSDLEEFDVVTYTQSGNVYNFVVSNETVEGVVEQITSDDEIVVDGVAYEKSAYYIEKTDKEPTKACKLGDEVVMYLDSYGQIAYTEITATGGTDTYAYVLGMEVEKGFEEDEDEISLIVLSTDNEKVKLPIAQKAKLKKNVYYVGVKNGTITDTSVEVGTVEERFTEGVSKADLADFGIISEGKIVKQLIKYAVDADGKLTEIETALNIKGKESFVSDGTTATLYTMDANQEIVPVEVNVKDANAADYTKIQNNLDKILNPAKFDEELNVFTKTYYTNSKNEFGKSFYTVSNTMSESSTVAGDRYSTAGAKLLLIPTSDGSVLTSDMGFYDSAEFFKNYNPYTALPSTGIEIYDVDKTGKAGLFVVTADLNTNIFKDFRGNYMLITKVGTGVNADGEPEYRITGQSNNYNNPATSEVSFTVSAETSIAPYVADSVDFEKLGSDKMKPGDLKAGDIIGYKKMVNGKVYSIGVLHSANYNNGPIFTNSNGSKVNAEQLGSTTLYMGALHGYIVETISEEDEETIRLATLKPGAEIDLSVKNDNVSPEYTPTGYKNYWMYDATKKTLKKIEYADIPLPEPVDSPVGKNVFTITSEDGTTGYYKCPRIVMQTHWGDNRFREVNFIYIDEGLFD